MYSPKSFIAAAVTVSILIQPSLALYDASSNANVVLYWVCFMVRL